MKILIRKSGNLRDSIPIDGEYYLLSQLRLDNIKSGDIYRIDSELQAESKGLKKGDFAFYVTTEIRTSIVENPVYNKGETENERIIAENLGNNLRDRTQHYLRDNRSGYFDARKDYLVVYINLWVKSDSTQTSKGDKCYFKEHTVLTAFYI